MNKPLHSVLMILLVAGVALCAPGSTAARRGPGNGSNRQDRCLDGRYAVILDGFYSGTGQAEVRPDLIRIRADVKTDDGRPGRLEAALPGTGPYFSGQGTLQGTGFNYRITIRGRMDAAKASRMVATFVAPDGHGARIVATMPTDLGDESWDDNPDN